VLFILADEDQQNEMLDELAELIARRDALIEKQKKDEQTGDTASS
jgi:hypothetical protein